MQKPKAKGPAASGPDSEVGIALKAVYADGFNIYAAINRLKKKMNRQEFPDVVLLGVCKSYWSCKPGIRGRWPWFLSSMEYQTRLWICDSHEAENAKHKRAPVSQSIRDIMKGMS
jgi:hypothetical protein